MKKSIPIWLTIIIIIETLPMFGGPLVGLFRPESFAFIKTLPNPSDMMGTVWLYSARNFAVGIALLVAFFLRNHTMLFILILIRLITDIIDLPNFLILGSPSSPVRLTAIFVLFYYLPAIYALRYLWKQMKTAG